MQQVIDAGSQNRVAFSATAHCLTGCATGEVFGMVIGTALNWDTWTTVALAVVLPFFFGYAMTIIPLLRVGISRGWGNALLHQHHGRH
jgi:Domain of unknown function (DUF4396)